MRILLVEDQEDFADGLKMGLQEAGYAVDLAYDGEQGEARALADDYDLLVIDWMLPKQDGATLIKRLREAGQDCPILMLTAMSDVEDRVEGLDAGADDYLTKPFAFAELFARLRALSRRVDREGPAANLQITVGPLLIDRRSRKVYWNGEPLELRHKEYEVLELLARRIDEAVTRTVIAESAWGSTFTSDDTINTTISGLRQTLRAVQDETSPALTLETVRGVGYRLTHHEAEPQATEKA